MSQQNVKMINLAHDIAKKKFGKTFPNPTVGCVIAKNSKIISKAVTNKSGRPHAEEIALAKAGHKAKGASMYVTLEPCFHSSKDGSCTDQILRSGIKEIFISAADPDFRTNYKSIKKLKKNLVKLFQTQPWVVSLLKILKLFLKLLQITLEDLMQKKLL